MFRFEFETEATTSLETPQANDLPCLISLTRMKKKKSQLGSNIKKQDTST